MDAIINDLKSAIDKLNVKTALADKRAAEAVAASKKYEVKAADLATREITVSEKEQKYRGFDNIEAAKESINKARAEVNSAKAEIVKEKAALVEAQANLAKDKKDIEEKIALYRKKNENCDKMAAKLELDRKDLEKNIIAQFTKSLTKG